MESLWNVLRLRQVTLLTEHRQDAFDQLDNSYRVLITVDQIGVEIDTNDAENMNAEKTELLIADRIKMNKQPSAENLYNLLDVLYKLIVYKLTNEGVVENLDPQHQIKYFLNPEYVEIPGVKLGLDFDAFNLDNVRLENVHHLWRLLVKISTRELHF